MPNSSKDYKNLVPGIGEYGKNIELTCIRCLFSNYLFRVQYKKTSVSINMSMKVLFVILSSIVFRQY